MNEASATELWQNMLTWLSSVASWDNLKGFANANFTTALIGSLAGAFAGAYAAQRIAERQKSRAEMLQELRSTNAAIALSFTICNSVLSLKKQHLRDMKSAFDAERASLLEYKRKREVGQIQGTTSYRFKADFRSIPLTTLPTDTLRDAVVNKLSVSARPLSLVASLVEYAALLNGALARRNAIIDRFRGNISEDDPTIPARYFGLPYEGGHVDQDYADTLDGISNYADDVIYYGHLLCQDLNDHGKRVRAEFERRHGTCAQTVAEVNFDEARASGLLPASARYQSWSTAFVRQKTDG